MMGLRAMALTAVATACLLSAGCGSDANEENITTRAQAGTPKEGTPKFQSYAEAQIYQAEQAKKSRAEAKGKSQPAAKRKRR